MEKLEPHHDLDAFKRKGAFVRLMADGLLAAAAVLLACSCSDSGADLPGGSSACQSADSVEPWHVQVPVTGDWSHCWNIGQQEQQDYPVLDADQAHEFALKLGTCIFGRGLEFIEFCALTGCAPTYLPSIDLPFVPCVLEAEDCNEVRCCYGISSSDLCDPGAIDASCDADVVVDCVRLPDGTGRVRKWDCGWSEGNPLCLLDDDGAVRCGTGECAGDSYDPELSACEGDTLSSCFEGVQRTVDCGKRHRTCGDVVTEEGLGHACVLDGGCLAPHCEENTAVICSGGAVILRQDCNMFGPDAKCTEGGLDEDGDWLGGCKLAEPECDWTQDETKAVCDGTTAKLCDEDVGAWVEFDCSQFNDGFCRKYAATDFGSEEKPDYSDPTQGSTVGCAESCE